MLLGAAYSGGCSQPTATEHLVHEFNTDASSGRATVQKDWIYDLAYSPNGELLASASKDNRVVLWDERGRVVRTLEGDKQERGAWSVAFSPDSRLLATGHGNGTIHVYRVSDWALQHTIAPWSHEGDSAHRSRVTRLSFPVVDVLVSGSEDRSIRAWRLDLEKNNGIIGLLTSSDPSSLWDKSAHESGVSALAATFDARAWYRQIDDENALPIRIATGSFNDEITIWEQLRLEKDNVGAVRDLELHRDWVWGLDFAGLDTLVSAGSDGQIIVFDIESGSTLQRLESAHDAFIRSLDVSENLAWVATGDTNGKVQLRELQWTGSPSKPSLSEVPEFEVQGHRGIVHAMRFNPQGTRLATAGSDCSIRIWEVPPSPRFAANQNFFRMELSSPFIIVLDCSGSMGAELQTIKQELKDLVTDLRRSGNAAGELVGFADDAGSALGSLQPINDAALMRLDAYLDNPRDRNGNSLGGGTNLTAALELTAEVAQDAAAQLPAGTTINVLLVTDGFFSSADHGPDANRRFQMLFDGVDVRLDAMAAPRHFLEYTPAAPMSEEERNLARLARGLGGYLGPWHLVDPSVQRN